MDTQRKYYENIFKHSLDYAWENAPGKDVIVNAIRYYYAEGRIPEVASVIDIGCGYGFLLNRLYSEVSSSWTFVGIDFSREAIDRGQKRFPHLTLFCENGSQTHFEPNTFDLLVSYGSYEHFDAPAKAIKEAGRILKEGGVFFILLPSLGIDRTDREDEGWYEEREVKGAPIRQLQWNLRRETWTRYFSNAELKLWDIAISSKFGALKPGVFYFGEKQAKYKR